MAFTNELEKGLAIKHNNDIYIVLDFQSFQKGRGGSNLWVKIRSLNTGKIIETNFAGDNKFETVPVERHPHEYLYADGDIYHFMHKQTFDQVGVNGSMISGKEFLIEGLECSLMIDTSTDAVMGVDLPMTVNLLVTYSEPGIKGDTATNALKSATVETGATIKVPMFVNEGDKIKIKTDTGDYVERVK